MTSKQDAARVVMAAHLVTDEVKKLASAEREALFDAMAADGTDRMSVRADDGAELGKIVFVAGVAKAKIVDESAFTAWVKNARPDQIREVVDKAFTDAILKTATTEGVAVDPETGEVIPGIELRDSSGYISVRPGGDAREQARELLAGSGLLQLEPAPAERRVERAPDIASWPGLDDGSDPW